MAVGCDDEAKEASLENFCEMSFECDVSDSYHDCIDAWETDDAVKCLEECGVESNCDDWFECKDDCLH